MTTYKELQSQIEKLQKEAEQARKTELANAIAEIHAKMKEYGISAEDLRGKPPKWMAGRDKAQFLIHNA